MELSNDILVGYEIKLKYWGANHKKNMPVPSSEKWHTSIKIDANWYEELFLPIVEKAVFHDFSDGKFFEQLKVPAYSLEEILAEKLRALIQRKYSAARDYYDIWRIEKMNSRLDWKQIVEVFYKKCMLKNLVFENVTQLVNDEIFVNLKNQWNATLANQIKKESLAPVELVVNDWKRLFSLIF